MDQKKCCGTCKWHQLETESSAPEWVCCNEESPYWSDHTGYEDICPDWEAR